MQKKLMLAVAGIFFSAGAFAQWPGAGPQKRPVLEALDLNHDGRLSAEELKAAPQSLRVLDKNNDGKITANEVSARPGGEQNSGNEMLAHLMAFDKSGKGYLVAEDLPERMRGIFARGDANHDGKLTPEELKAMSEHQGAPEGPAGNRGGQWGPFRSDPLLAALDTNHDGELSADEIAQAAGALALLDKNGNGMIDPDEMAPHQMTPTERLHHFIEEFDANKDGKIARNEAPERMVSSGEFEKIDTNHNGELDREELLQFFTAQAQSAQARPSN